MYVYNVARLFIFMASLAVTNPKENNTVFLFKFSIFLYFY